MFGGGARLTAWSDLPDSNTSPGAAPITNKLLIPTKLTLLSPFPITIRPQEGCCTIIFLKGGPLFLVLSQNHLFCLETCKQSQASVPKPGKPANDRAENILCLLACFSTFNVIKCEIKVVAHTSFRR